ncbi:MAG TPA: M56 family metallopeptidase [Candidatus Angelobacter sp.]|jgi:beta-lactamase regulating signal transducer with metallopeptidase domain
MFYLLSISLCCAVFFIVLAGSSALCMWAGRLSLPAASSLTSTTAANLLFTIRILPVFLASLATFGFVLPALLKFEPRSTGELVGWPLFGLAILGCAVLIVMLIRTATILRSTRLVGAKWRRHSKKLSLENTDVPVYCLDDAGAGPGSVLAVLGFLRPKIFVAKQIVDKLTPAELMAAVEHERAHVTSFDNLKQLVFKVTRIPRWLRVFGVADSAWTNASEIAADEAALASGISVLDLSSALIKVAALSTHAVVGKTVAASHLVPMESGSCLRARVDRLQEILAGDDPARCTSSRKHMSKSAISLVLAVIAYAACVNTALPWVHEVLEALVR